MWNDFHKGDIITDKNPPNPTASHCSVFLDRIPQSRVETERELPLKTPQVLPHLLERGVTSHSCHRGRGSPAQGMAKTAVVDQQHPGGWIQLPFQSWANANPGSPFTLHFPAISYLLSPQADFRQESQGGQKEPVTITCQAAQVGCSVMPRRQLCF